MVREREKEDVKQITGHIKLGFYIVRVCECERRRAKVTSICKSILAIQANYSTVPRVRIQISKEISVSCFVKSKPEGNPRDIIVDRARAILGECR